MTHIYILALLATSVLSSVFTLVLMRKDQIKLWWLKQKNRSYNRKKEQIRTIVLEYLKELQNVESND